MSRDTILPPMPSPPLAGLRVLLVDDQEINQLVARNILERAGATVAVAGDGLAALAILEARPREVDAVLMDISMPRMDGYEATRAIRGRLGLTALPVIALGSNGEAADREQARAAGMDGLLTKPVDAGALIAALAAPLGRREPPAQPVADAIPLPADLPGISLRTALIRLGGDRRAWLEMMASFEAGHGEAVTEVRRLLAAGQGEGAAKMLHRLRGVAANLGAVEVARLAAETEAAIKDKKSEVLPDRIEALAQALATVFALARQLPPPPPPAASPAPGPRDLAAGLAELRQLLGSQNLRAGALFESLRPGLAATLGPQAPEAVAAAIAVLDFAGAETLVVNMEKKLKGGDT